MSEHVENLRCIVATSLQVQLHVVGNPRSEISAAADHLAEVERQNRLMRKWIRGRNGPHVLEALLRKRKAAK